MSFHPSRAALDRAKGTIHACEILHAHAPEIAHVCGETGQDNLVVPVIDRKDMALAGIWTVPLAEAPRRIAELEEHGWAFTFSGGTSVHHIEEQALSTARLAFLRWMAMQRWAGRHR